MSHCCSESDYVEIVGVLEAWYDGLKGFDFHPQFFESARALVRAVRKRTRDGISIVEELRKEFDAPSGMARGSFVDFVRVKFALPQKKGS